ncbi:SHOCT domain-containing protein [Streptomyces kaniharaensis]|uniref:SHOCT domain-containing protein n=1 Tax=Streptomyces kaniharaensis TaxID=212423 RepID=A0A6N7KVI7_9ACTN|nr:SHOCT domain-containing protein [Streptomyces kaniharaensis]MQS15530.1 SHOCT domain-containing protein [Streptomyces kaniharaensis]
MRWGAVDWRYAVDYPLLNIFFTTMWIFMWILWFFLLFRVVVDLFRDDGLSGWAKAGWAVFVIVLPFLGVLVYLIARGQGMGDRERAHAQQSEQAFRAYIQEAAATPSGAGTHADDLAKLASLRNAGDITEEEYQRAKEKVLA